MNYTYNIIQYIRVYIHHYTPVFEDRTIIEAMKYLFMILVVLFGDLFCYKPGFMAGSEVSQAETFEDAYVFFLNIGVPQK